MKTSDCKEERNKRGLGILAQAAGCHAALAAYRAERDRNKRYHYGDQWGDIIEVDGCRITEEAYIKRQGSVPLKNNLIRRLVRNVIGVYNSQSTEPVCLARDSGEQEYGELMTKLLHCSMQNNRLREVYTRTLEEFLIGGLVVHRKSYGLRNGQPDCRTDFVQPNNFFVDSRMRDFRMWDCRLVGEYHDVDLHTLVARFAGSEDDVARLMDIYGLSEPDDAHSPGSPLCRVAEVWRKEARPCHRCHDRALGRVYRADTEAERLAVERENAVRRRSGRPLIATRWSVQEVWRYYFIAPDGTILAEGDTPYAHGEHPYVMKAYPMIDGEIHSFVNDVIDQQRHTNRLITMYDWIMRASAKGVLLVPEDCVPAGMSPADFADAWSRFNGVIVYRPSMQGEVPRQVASNSTNIGIKELLDVQLRFFEDISGVNSSLQGKTGNVAISAALYGQQTQNATTTLLDILDSFAEFVRDAAYKDAMNIQQYYTPEMVRDIAGDVPRGVCNNTGGLRRVAIDLNIRPCLNTPARRDTVNSQLMEIWKSGQISLEQMLAAGHFDFTIPNGE